MVIFLVGSLLDVLMGGALRVRYLRREVAGDIGPKLKRMQLQLDNIDTELNLAITNPPRRTDRLLPRHPARQLPASARRLTTHRAAAAAAPPGPASAGTGRLTILTCRGNPAVPWNLHPLNIPQNAVVMVPSTGPGSRAPQPAKASPRPRRRCRPGGSAARRSRLLTPQPAPLWAESRVMVAPGFPDTGRGPGTTAASMAACRSLAQCSGSFRPAIGAPPSSSGPRHPFRSRTGPVPGSW